MRGLLSRQGVRSAVALRASSLVGLLCLLACDAPPPQSAADVGAGSGPETLTPAPVPEAVKEEPKPARPAMNSGATASYQSGMAAFLGGDLVGAETHFRSALAQDPAAHQAHYGLGTALQRQGKLADAVTSYTNALSLVPDYEDAIHALTKVYLAGGQAADAEAFLNAQRNKAPHSAAVLSALAEVKSTQKDSQAAQSLAQAALKKEPDYRPAMVTLARDHYRQRRLELAQYTLKAILDGYGPENPPRDKNNAEARLLRAQIYREQDNRKGAIFELRRVVELRPDLVEARLSLATYLLEAGNAPEAIPLLEGALPFEPANVLTHLNLGDAYRLQGRPDEALKQLQWVTQADASLAQPHYNIGLVYLFSKVPGVDEKEATVRAIAAFEKYQKMQPRSRPGAGSDAEELLRRARQKKMIQEAMEGDDEFE